MTLTGTHHFRQVKSVASGLPATMFSKVAIFCLFACVCAQQQPKFPPSPYSFQYEHVDAKTGAKVTQSENGDNNNVKTGSYGINDPTGLYRLVQYIADAQGFRVTVDTNEPGTKSHDAANARYTSKAANLPAVAAAYTPYRPLSLRPSIVRPVSTLHAVHATPLSLHAVPITLHALHAVPVTRPFSPTVAAAPGNIQFTLGRARGIF
ncbi:cuticle protein 16.8-like [Haemaphysalis longicornis]